LISYTGRIVRKESLVHEEAQACNILGYHSGIGAKLSATVQVVCN